MRALKKEAERKFNICFTIWFISALCIAYFTMYTGYDVTNNSFVNLLSDKIPSIEKAPKKTKYPIPVKTLWIYLIISTPVFFVVLLKFTKDGENIISRKFFIISLLLFIFSAFMIFTGSFFGEGQNRYAKFYRNSLLGSVFLSFTFFT